MGRASRPCSEFRVYRHLLEQPSPLAARNSACERRNSVGQPASSILAVAGSIRDRLDGGESFRFVAGRCVRDRAAVGGYCIFHPHKGSH